MIVKLLLDGSGALGRGRGIVVARNHVRGLTHDSDEVRVVEVDAGLDHGHRFAMLGAIFRPMRQFLRRTIDPVEQSDLTSTSESSD